VDKPVGNPDAVTLTVQESYDFVGLTKKEPAAFSQPKPRHRVFHRFLIQITLDKQG
jgi:hypothetical protein